MSSILFVCHGNVCRSVYGQALLRSRLESVRPEVVVASAGVEADPGLLGCELVAERAGARGASVAGHVARRLRTQHVVTADLVLCATVAQRSAVAQLVPDARNRTFTLREAGRLAVWDRTHRPDAPGWVPADSPADLADRLRAARGRVAAPLPVPVRRRWWTRATLPLDPWDIADGHHERLASHVETLDLVEEAVDELAQALGAVPLVTPHPTGPGSSARSGPPTPERP